jgi:putative ABC transport system permease protein
VIKVALKGLAGRKLRAVLTALAIVLGVTMVSGTFVLTDTINKAFNNIFQGTYAHTDAVVSGKAVDINVQGDSAATPSIPQDLLAKIRALPDVAAATGSVMDDSNTKIIKKNGKAVNTNGAPSFGFGIDPSQTRFNPLKLVSGHWPTAADQVVIDSATASDLGYKVGDTIKVATLQPVRSFELVGLAQYGDVASLGSATFTVFTIPTAQSLLERQGTFDAISVAAKNGKTPAQLVQEIRPILPVSAQVRTGTQQAKQDQKDVSFTKFIRYFLLGFAGVALFVGAFVIFNTLSITVAQRTREFATLRTIGGSRRQVLWSVVTEAFVIGLVASIIGLFLGLGLAAGLNALFKALNMDLPTQGLVFAPRTIVVSLLIGTIVTLVAGIFPAIRATRVPPIAAVREGFVLPKGRWARISPYIALVVIALAVVLLSYSLFKDHVGTAQRLIAMAVGVLALFFGVALISSRLVRPLAAFVGWPATRIGGAAGRLAKGNSTRNPGRTASTAAALMIGIALVTFVAVLANGMKSSNSDAIKQQVKAEYVLTSQDGFSPFVPAAGDAVGRASDAEFTTSVRSGLGKALGESGYITGIQPSAIAQAYTFKWKQGSDEILSHMGRNGAIVAKDFADDKDLKVGDRFPLLTPNGEKTQLVVKGIYEPPPFFPILGEVSITQSLFDSLYERPENSFVFVNVRGEPTAATTRSLEASVKDFPDGKVQTREGWIERQNKDFNDFLSMLYVLLALSVVVSIFGMVNTLVLSVFERTRELGMLRAVGMTRRQARRMVRHESVITALIGAALGLPLGIFLALLMTKALSQFNVQIAIPYKQLVIFAVVAVIVGMFAAIFPARRAARLNVLRALQYE